MIFINGKNDVVVSRRDEFKKAIMIKLIIDRTKQREIISILNERFPTLDRTLFSKILNEKYKSAHAEEIIEETASTLGIRVNPLDTAIIIHGK